jgi:hypothetical protein
VRSADPEVVRWVRCHLDCTFGAATHLPPGPDVAVAVVADEALVTVLAAAVDGRRTVRVPGFSGMHWDFAALDDDVDVWYHGAEVGDRVVVCRTGTDRWVVAATDRQQAALSAVRVCRELVRTKLAVGGALAVHGGLAVVAGLGGLLFVGPSGAGKTTLALALAQREGYVVSTDQTALLAQPDGGVLGVGYPDTNRVAPGTARRLAAHPATAEVPPLRAASVAGGDPAKRWLTAVETEVLYGVASAPCARVDAIVWVRAERSLPAPVVGTVPPAAVAAGLADEFQARHPLIATYWLAAGGTQPPTGRVEDLMRLVRHAVLVDLAWDPTRHELAGVRAALAGALARRRTRPTATGTGVYPECV